MKTKNKLIGILLIVTCLAAGLLPVFATTDQPLLTEKQLIRSMDKTQIKPVNRLTALNPFFTQDLTDLDESTIDDAIDKALEAEEIPEEETEIAPPLWFLNAYGLAIVKDPVTDSTATRNRVQLQLLAEKMRTTEHGALYEVHWARVNHNAEKYEVDGYILLDGNGIFYMRLEGDVSFKSIGRIHPFWFGIRVSMKGYIVEDEIIYSTKMRGWAIPLNLRHLARLKNQQ